MLSDNFQLLYSVSEAAHLLGVSRSRAYELIKDGLLRLVHIGRSARVPRDSIESFVQSLKA